MRRNACFVKLLLYNIFWCSSLRPRQFLCPSSEPMQRNLEKDVDACSLSSDPRYLFLFLGEGNCPLLKFLKSHPSTVLVRGLNVDKVLWTVFFWHNSSWPRELTETVTWRPSVAQLAPVVCLLSRQQGTQPAWNPALPWSDSVTPLCSLELRRVTLLLNTEWALLAAEWLSQPASYPQESVIVNLLHFSPSYGPLSLYFVKIHLNFLCGL